MKATEQQIEMMRRYGNDTIVQCPKCKRTQYLQFKNGLKNGWSKCCNGLTMPIIYQEANIDKTIKQIVSETFNEHKEKPFYELKKEKEAKT